MATMGRIFPYRREMGAMEDAELVLLREFNMAIEEFLERLVSSKDSDEIEALLVHLNVYNIERKGGEVPIELRAQSTVVATKKAGTQADAFRRIKPLISHMQVCCFQLKITGHEYIYKLKNTLCFSEALSN